MLTTCPTCFEESPAHEILNGECFDCRRLAQRVREYPLALSASTSAWPPSARRIVGLDALRDPQPRKVFAGRVGRGWAVVADANMLAARQA